MNFEQLGIPSAVVQALAAEAIATPTAIQEMAIPALLKNTDAVIQSETGSGKTLAYLLPFYARESSKTPGAQLLVLVPTRELAMQVHHQVERLSENASSPIRSQPIFADVSIKAQAQRLKAKPQIIIGTTTRILELIRQRKIPAHTVKTIVIDEADKLLSSDNIEGVKAVLKCCMRDVQIVLCSASIGKDTLRQTEALGRQPVMLQTAEKQAIPESIEHMVVCSGARDKTDVLYDLLQILKPKRSIVFINGAQELDKAMSKLQIRKLPIACIRGSYTKQERQKALADFTSGKVPTLLASDMAARGLDIKGVSAVFHLDLPENTRDYLHRAGRTGRVDKKGVSVCIVTHKEQPMIAPIEKAFGITIKPMRLSDSHKKLLPVVEEDSAE